MWQFLLCIAFVFWTQDVSSKSKKTPSEAQETMSVCRTTLKAAIHGIYYDEAGHILSSTPLTEKSIVVDSNLLISYKMMKEGSAADRHRSWYNFITKQKKSAARHKESFHLWMASRTAKEVTLNPRTSQIPVGSRIVPLTVRRDSEEYQSVLAIMNKEKVGNSAGDPMKDREIVTDLFFAQKRASSTVPNFATADNGIIRPLCLLQPECAVHLKHEYNKEHLKRLYPQGFEVTVKDKFGIARTIRIIPV